LNDNGRFGRALCLRPALREVLFDVTIAAKNGAVMRAFRSYGLWIWSFEDHRAMFQSSSPELQVNGPLKQLRHLTHPTIFNLENLIILLRPGV
jgi:hypothetical protein